MLETLTILLAGIFLPLFPMSMVFNAILDRVTHSWLRLLLFSAWPLIGLFIVLDRNLVLPDWLLALALSTSALYALRLLTLREVNQWSGFLATSMWSLLWLPMMQQTSPELLYGYAISMSAPLVLLVLLSAGLEQRFGAAYMDLYGGLARTIPRFSGVLVAVVVAAIATPLFPTFFIMLEMVVKTISITPLAATVLLLIWLFWSWAGARLIQGLIVGRASTDKITDMEITTIGLYSMVLLALVVGGIYLSGVIL
ncbi:MAG: hypothetical protein WBO93_08830 [Gammaproteobacteria bacterium]